MKKIISLLFIPFVFTACSMKSYTPIIETSFCYDAKYIMGDFSFNCNVKKEDSVVTITVLDTRAKGLVIVSDGKNVTLKKDEFSKSFDIQNINKTNPSIVVYDVFEYIKQNAEVCVKKTDTGFAYYGTTALGSFEAYQSSDNKFYLITIPNANIRIELTPSSV